MVGLAIGRVEVSRYRILFGYILVDELSRQFARQARWPKVSLDISPDAQLFTVGGYWQAIYRFLRQAAHETICGSAARNHPP